MLSFDRQMYALPVLQAYWINNLSYILYQNILFYYQVYNLLCYNVDCIMLSIQLSETLCYQTCIIQSKDRQGNVFLTNTNVLVRAVQNYIYAGNINDYIRGQL